MATIIIIAVVGIAAGMAVGYIVANRRIAALTDERTQIVAARDVLSARLDAALQQAEQLRADRDSLRADYEQRLADEKAEAEKRLADYRRQQAEQMSRQAELIREQINSASEEILRKRSQELSANNREQLAAILNPLHENIRQMRQAVEKSDREQTDSMARLDQSIKENLRQAREVGERADKLAQALTSENKAQGNFGELRLRTLLQNMGLEEGTQFEEQVTLRDDNGNTLHADDGHRMVPDVVLHFPDNRDVVIDSKMSLKAFTDYHNATTDAQRADALSRHVLSVRSHVRELAHKNYSSYLRTGSARLDFVVMYVYSESALQLALTADPALWRDAYDQGVIISGSQNLYMMLRVLEMTWRQVRQAENQDKVMAAADELVNRVQMFYERFQAADDQLAKTQKAFDTLRTITAPTGKSIATAAANLLKYGAKENPKRKTSLPKAPEGSLPRPLQKEG